MTQNLFKKDWHYGCLAVFLLIGYIAFMLFIFPKEWALTSQVDKFVEAVSNMVPMLRHYRHAKEYDKFFGVFYAGFWMLSPIWLFLGWMISYCYFLTTKGYERLQNLSALKMTLSVFFTHALLIFFWASPIYENTSRLQSMSIAQELFEIFKSWGTIAGFILLSGAAVRLPLIWFKAR